MAKLALNLHNIACLPWTEHQHRSSCLTSATSPPRTVHVSIGSSGRLKLNDEIDILYVDSTGSNISCNENVKGARAEGRKGGISLLLSYISVKSLGCKTLEDCTRNNLVSIPLGFHENDCLTKDLLLNSGVTLFLLRCSRGSNGIRDLALDIVILFRFRLFGDHNSDDVLQDRPFGIVTRRDLKSYMPYCRSGARTCTVVFVCGIYRYNILLVIAADFLYPRRCSGRK